MVAPQVVSLLVLVLAQGQHTTSNFSTPIASSGKKCTGFAMGQSLSQQQYIVSPARRKYRGDLAPTVEKSPKVRELKLNRAKMSKQTKESYERAIAPKLYSKVTKSSNSCKSWTTGTKSRRGSHESAYTLHLLL